MEHGRSVAQAHSKLTSQGSAPMISELPRSTPNPGIAPKFGDYPSGHFDLSWPSCLSSSLYPSLISVTAGPISDLGEHAEEAARRPAELALQVEEAAWDVVSTRNARDDEPGPFFTVESFHRGFSQEPSDLRAAAGRGGEQQPYDDRSQPAPQLPFSWLGSTRASS